MLAFVWKVAKPSDFSPNSDWLQSGKQCGERGGSKHLHMWVWSWACVRVCGGSGGRSGARLGRGDGIDIWCARLLMWTEASGEKGNVPIQISITLSSSPRRLVAMTSWRTGGRGADEGDWFLMCKRCLPEACGGHISRVRVSCWPLDFDGLTTKGNDIDVFAPYTINPRRRPHVLPSRVAFRFLYEFDGERAYWSVGKKMVLCSQDVSEGARK